MYGRSVLVSPTESAAYLERLFVVYLSPALVYLDGDFPAVLDCEPAVLYVKPRRVYAGIV